MILVINKVDFRLQLSLFANLDCRLLINSMNINRQLNLYIMTEK